LNIKKKKIINPLPNFKYKKRALGLHSQRTRFQHYVREKN
jgi:hypothetical protein